MTAWHEAKIWNRGWERLERTKLGVYQRISRLMVRELTLADTLQAISKLVQDFTQCDSCLVYLIDNNELVLCASNSPHPRRSARCGSR